MYASIRSGSPQLATMREVMNIMYQNDAHVEAVLFLVFITSLIVASWGEPDLIDALIYHLSDGHYK